MIFFFLGLENFENSRNFSFFCFVLQWIKRENDHNWNRRCPKSLDSQIRSKDYLNESTSQKSFVFKKNRTRYKSWHMFFVDTLIVSRF